MSRTVTQAVLNNVEQLTLVVRLSLCVGSRADNVLAGVCHYHRY